MEDISQDQHQEIEEPIEAGAKMARKLLGASVDHTSEAVKVGIAPFVIGLTQEDRPAFTSLMKRASLANVVKVIETLARVYEARGQTFSDGERRMIKLFSELDRDQSRQGRELADMNLQFRWISTTEDLGVEDIVATAPIYGGNPPSDRSGWVHAGTSVVEDFMVNPLHDKPGVLLIYDGSKLVPITESDIAADWKSPTAKRTYMHAQKAAPGLELKDALVGMISFDTPH